MKTHLQTNLEQYHSRSQAYLESPVHAAGPDLARAQALVGESVSHHGFALDVGCGAGHLSFALAPRLARVVAFDPYVEMLATVREAAFSRNLSQIETSTGTAEALPFEDGSFDLVCTRYSAHHWTNLELALAEMERVLKPGGCLLLIDILGDEDALADTHLQTIELLRDRSHVRNRSASEWTSLLAAAGFGDVLHEALPTRIDFVTWVARMRTPPGRVAMIREVQIEAPKEVRDALGFQQDGSFTVQTGLFFSRKGS